MIQDVSDLNIKSTFINGLRVTDKSVINIVEDVFTQSYDWKMNDNVADLGTKITLN